MTALDELVRIITTTPFPDLTVAPRTNADVEAVRDGARAWSTAVQEAYGSLEPHSIYRKGLLNLFRLPEPNHGSMRFAANVLGPIPEEFHHTQIEIGRRLIGLEAHMAIADEGGYREIPLTVEKWPDLRRVLSARYRASRAQVQRLIDWVEPRLQPFRRTSSRSSQSASSPLACSTPQLPDILQQLPHIIEALDLLSSSSPGAIRISTVATSDHPLAVAIRFGQRHLEHVAQAAVDAGMPPFSLIIAGRRTTSRCALAMLRCVCDLVVAVSVKNASDPALDPGDEYAIAVLSTAFKNGALDRLQRQANLEMDFLLRSGPDLGQPPVTATPLPSEVKPDAQPETEELGAGGLLPPVEEPAGTSTTLLPARPRGKEAANVIGVQPSTLSRWHSKIPAWVDNEPLFKHLLERQNGLYHRDRVLKLARWFRAATNNGGQTPTPCP